MASFGTRKEVPSRFSCGTPKGCPTRVDIITMHENSLQAIAVVARPRANRKALPHPPDHEDGRAAEHRRHGARPGAGDLVRRRLGQSRCARRIPAGLPIDRLGPGAVSQERRLHRHARRHGMPRADRAVRGTPLRRAAAGRRAHRDRHGQHAADARSVSHPARPRRHRHAARPDLRQLRRPARLRRAGRDRSSGCACSIRRHGRTCRKPIRPASRASSRACSTRIVRASCCSARPTTRPARSCRRRWRR